MSDILQHEQGAEIYAIIFFRALDVYTSARGQPSEPHPTSLADRQHHRLRRAARTRARPPISSA